MYAAGDVLIVHAGRLPSGKLGTVLPGSGDARPMAGLLQS
jgi:hypothetical protein